MRLTLRTMLGFMDKVLEPKDAQEIGQKIEESDFARGLLTRMRDLMRRVRLPAPDPNERGQGLDANSVAEYLDNTLPGERVADFEKVCLESDSHLAEVASCHQILALVLGEPAEIDDRSRQRMYAVASSAEASKDVEAVAMAAVGAPQPPPAEEPRDDKPERHKPAVPDYLRDEPPHPSGSMLPVIAAVLLGLLVITLLLGAMGQFERGTPLGDLVRNTFTGPSTEEKAAEKSDAAAPAVLSGTTAAAPSSPAASGSNAQAATSPPAGDAKTPPGPAAPASGKKDASGVAAAVAQMAQPSVKPPAAEGTTLTIKPPTGAAGTASSAAAGKPSLPTELASLMPAKSSTAASPPPVAPAAGPPAAAAEAVGRLVSEKQILLETDGASGWRRLPAQAPVRTATSLLALPGFQPVVALRVPLTVQMLSGTEVEFLPADAQGVPGVNVRSGRLVIRAVGPRAQLRVMVGPRQATLVFPSADSQAALVVGRIRAAGSDPLREPGDWGGDLFASGGQVTWMAADAPPQTLTAPSLWKLAQQPGQTPLAPVELPPWALSGDDSSPLDKRAALRLEQDIRSDRSVQLSLRELLGVSQREAVSLAIRSLACIGEYDPMAAVFDSQDQRFMWDECLNQLQLALARGPETAAQVRQGFEKQYTTNAAPLYRMLWGYSEKDITAGSGAALVGYLDHEQLAFRVLAFYNLEKIAVARYGYQPYSPAIKRVAAVAQWRKRLAAGLLPPKPGDVKKPADVKKPSAAPAAAPAAGPVPL